MSKNKAWIQYTRQGQIVPGSLIVSSRRPVNGVWYEVITDICCDTELPFGLISSRQKAFVKYDASGNIVPGSLIVTNAKLPRPGIWKEVYIDICCVSSNDDRVAYLSGTGDCCPGGSGRCGPVTIYLLQSCIDNPQIGCQVWGDQAGTIPVPDASYFINSGIGPLKITTFVGSKVSPAESFVISITPCT
jgi:hypothetical protein